MRLLQNYFFSNVQSEIHSPKHKRVKEDCEEESSVELFFLAVDDLNCSKYISGSIKISPPELLNLTAEIFIDEARRHYANHPNYKVFKQSKLFWCKEGFQVLACVPSTLVMDIYSDFHAGSKENPFFVSNGQFCVSVQFKNEKRNVTANIACNLQEIACIPFSLSSEKVYAYGSNCFLSPNTIPISLFPEFGTEQNPFVLELNSVFLQQFTTIDDCFKCIPFRDDKNFHQIDKRYVENSGIFCPHEGLLLYKSVAFKEEVGFLTEKFQSDEYWPNIYGYSGIGKSVTAFSVACSLIDSFTVVLFIKQKKITAVLNHQDLFDFLKYGIPLEGRSILFLDGFVHNLHAQLHDLCLAWLRADTSNRKLSFISPMAYPENEKIRINGQYRISNKIFYSWKFEEYVEAAKNETFWKQILPYLDSIDKQPVKYYNHFLEEFKNIKDENLRNAEINDLKQEMLFSKFYYAGFCPRYMFSISTEQVKEILKNGINALGHLKGVRNNLIGYLSSKPVHKLVGCFLDGNKFYEVSLLPKY